MGFAVALGCAGTGSSNAPGASSSSSSVDGSPSREPSQLDALFDEAWRADKLVASPEIDDATYLRRVSIDLIGRIPSFEELKAFEADPGSDKRARIVEKLLDTPEHARHLARLWEVTLLGPEVKSRLVDRGALRRWLESKFAVDTRWDVLARELVTAEGKSSVGGARKGAYLADDPDRAKEERDAGVNGATNYALRFAKSPEDMAGKTARAFMGVQIQCAQCHDHKSEEWKQTDFRGMAATFTRMRFAPVDRSQGEMPVFEIESASRPPRRLVNKDETVALLADLAPRALDGTQLAQDEGARRSLATWMTSVDNAWFSRAMVNRVWGELMGEGFVDPIDDMRPSNTPVLPAALDLLAHDFESHGYDLDWLYATICASKAYGRALGGNGQGSRAALFSHAALRPMTSDALLDSVFVASDVTSTLEDRAPQRAEQIKTLLRRKMSFVFEDDVESNGAAYDGTLQQALFSMNGALSTAATTYREGALLESLLEAEDDEAIAELYLRTLGRPPRPEEVVRAKALLSAPSGPDPAAEPGGPQQGRKKKGGKRPGGGGRKAIAADGGIPAGALRSEANSARERGFEDLFWALLNSSEFYFRR